MKTIVDRATADVTPRFQSAKSSKLKTICAHTLDTLFMLVMEIFVGSFLFKLVAEV